MSLEALKSAIQRSNFGYQCGFLGFIRFVNILRMTHYAVHIHPRYSLRLLLLMGSSLGSLPVRLWESLTWGKRISQVRIDTPPIFIIGHWRSGTTHLHNLMSQDTHLGYLSMYQAMVPDCSLVGRSWLNPLLSSMMPAKRPMDNMTWPMDAPQEEEIPLAKMMPHCFYTQFLFPRESLNLFHKYVLMQGATPRLLSEFKKKNYRLLQIATIHSGGRRLVLKNPVNTARVRLLLELFPDAKFVHIHRSPYDVFVSTRNLRRNMHGLTTLQTMRPGNADETILTVYEEMMGRYFEDRSLIPEGNLAEVRFEDLEQNPLSELQRVYETLGLPGYSQAEPAFQTYVASQKSYQKNSFELSAEDRAQVEQRWAFAFQELGYALQV